MSKKKKIFVTQPHLPDLNNFKVDIEKIWKNKILTNGGEFHEEFEKKLAQFLNVKYISLFTNATIALVTAIKAQKITGEVITTPYSFVATSHSILWNDIKPVFVDIEPDSLNIDPSKIENQITEKTSAILAVHCYGNPCDVDAIEKIAKKYNLKVIYDAAHAFGADCHCNDLLNHGDMSILSFHATKVFNTFEGGAIISKTKEQKEHIDSLKNFGIISETEITGLGINGKMDELRSAIGLRQLEEIDYVFHKRKLISNLYDHLLENIDGITCLNKMNQATKKNYAYYPIKVTEEFPVSRDRVYEYLKSNYIYTRRYFYPLISNFEIYNKLNGVDSRKYPVALKASSEILCLPIYPDLSLDDVKRIVAYIIDAGEL